MDIAQESPVGRIVTFYSYKGGVGRSMALANIGVLLARTGRPVLLVDWDLEAPGLDRYFSTYPSCEPERHGGLLALLEDVRTETPGDTYKSFLRKITVSSFGELHLLASGDDASDYSRRLASFSWSDFFNKNDGSQWLEKLRVAWTRDYGFVLIDSRTGVTESSGICTIKLPDQLVFVVSANQQNIDGCKRIIATIHRARLRELSSPPRLFILPLVSRADARQEKERSAIWFDKCADLFAPVVGDWLHKAITPSALIERTKLPHVPYYSFGEDLAVVRDRHTDPEFLPHYYVAAAGIIESDFRVDPELLLGNVAAQAIRSDEARRTFLEDERRQREKTQQKRRRLFFLTAAAALILVAGVVATSFIQRERYRRDLEVRTRTVQELLRQLEERRSYVMIEAIADKYKQMQKADAREIGPEALQKAIQDVASSAGRSPDDVRKSLGRFVKDTQAKSDPTVVESALADFIETAQDEEIAALVDRGVKDLKEKRVEDAEHRFVSVLRLITPVSHRGQWLTAASGYADILRAQKKPSQELEYRRKILAIAKESKEGNFNQSVGATEKLIECLILNDRSAEVDSVVQDTVHTFDKISPENNLPAREFAEFLLAKKMPGQAENLYLRVISFYKDHKEEYPLSLRRAQSGLSMALRDQRRFKEAEKLLKDALAELTADKQAKATARMILLIGYTELLNGLNRETEASDCLKRSVELAPAVSRETLFVIDTLGRLAALLWHSGQMTEAEAVYRRALFLVATDDSKIVSLDQKDVLQNAYAGFLYTRGLSESDVESRIKSAGERGELLPGEKPADSEAIIPPK